MGRGEFRASLGIGITRDYGRPGYITYYRNQLRELLTNYGDVFEVWFDGANGGDGYYGGARETRRIDRRAYYDTPNTWEIVRELQPMAVTFSDGGPDIRWVGNGGGAGSETNWATLRRDEFAPGDFGSQGVTDGAARRHALGARRSGCFDSTWMETPSRFPTHRRRSEPRPTCRLERY